MTMNPGELTVSLCPATEQDFSEVGGQLTDFTVNEAGGPDYKPLAFIFNACVAGRTEPVGRLVATELWGAVEVNLLRVEKGFYGQGIGKRLMSAVEDFAAARGDRSVHLWTPSFQGEGFYERCGYTEMGRLPLDTPGHFGGQQQYRINYGKVLG